jgi:uncharacterized protein (TIGR00730 family)
MTRPELGASVTIDVVNDSTESFSEPSGVAPIRSVAVYCGSSSGTHAEYTEAATELGMLLAQRGLTLIYGGGKVGLMGAVADSVLRNGGRVVGVITEALRNAEIAHTGLSELETVANMHERKLRMAHLADGFIALPGGFGTWDELCEVLTWTQLGIHHKPVVLVNTRDYWNSLLAQARHAAAEGFMKPVHAGLMRSAPTPTEALDLLVAPIPLPESKWIHK